MDQPRTLGFLVIRIDGDNIASPTAATGDLVSVYKVMTDAYAEVITGEEAFRYTITFLPQGDLAVRAVVGGGTVVTPATLAIDVAESLHLTATVGGRKYTNGVKWTSSDATKATVSSAGVVTGVAAGTATITATYEATGGTDTTAVTVS
jgi:hypothetical protein